MDRHDIAEQVRVEQELLRHVMEGLRLSTTWQVQGPDASRKLSTLGFVTGSFQRHQPTTEAIPRAPGAEMPSPTPAQVTRAVPATPVPLAGGYSDYID